MPLHLDIKRMLTARSDRVKCVDLHPTEPWMLASLYNGTISVWNYDKQEVVKSFEVCDMPVRAAKFVSRKNWIIAGSDDMQIRVYNYNTLERVYSFEAHCDYIRSIVIHPTLSYILTGSDDMQIKLWNWDKQWLCQQVFEGHTHYVMQIVINPKDNNTFASASLDRTLKVWQLGSSTPNFTLEGHKKGVNCIDYYCGGDKPYLISGADDKLVKIWDYQNKTCLQTLEGHVQNITAVCFHPEQPIIMTGSEDGTVRIWHSNTYRLESTLNYALERVWTISCLRGSNNVAVGYDEGSIMFKVGREEPAISMDSNGKVIWARHSEIQQVNLKFMNDTEVRDGEHISLAIKELGNSDIYPQTIAHNPNGRFVVICGEDEYIIYTAMALRNKAFGAAQEFVWAQDSSEYAILENNCSVKIFRNFKERTTFKPEFQAVDGIFGGFHLGVKSASVLCFYDWDDMSLIRRIEIQPKYVFWSETGRLVCIATDNSYFILKYNSEEVEKVLVNNVGISEDGIDNAFLVLGEVQESVRSGLWVGDCFIYTSAIDRLRYNVGGECVTIAQLDKTMYLLGYIPTDNRIYLSDKDLNVVSYSLILSVLEYQTAVIRKNFATANIVLPTIPREQLTRVAYFLEKNGFKKEALRVSTDPDHRFDLALQLKDIKLACELAVESQSKEKWKRLSDITTIAGMFDLSKECLRKAHDFGGLLLLTTSAGCCSHLETLAEESNRFHQYNVSFIAYFYSGQLLKCLELLITNSRIPEAAMFARTYLPSEVSRCVQLWRESLSKINVKIGQTLADPTEHDNLFPNYYESCVAEQWLHEQRKQQTATNYSNVKLSYEWNPLLDAQEAVKSGNFIYQHALPTKESILVDMDVEGDLSIPQPLNMTGTESYHQPLLDNRLLELDKELEIYLEGIHLEDDIDNFNIAFDPDDELE